MDGDARLARRLAELQILFETVQDLSSTLSTQEVIERLVDRTLDHLDSEVGSVLLDDGDEVLRIVHARGLPDEVVRSTRIPFGDGISGFVARRGEPLLIADVEADPRFRRPNHERYYTRSCISAPLVHRGRIRGVINVNNKRDHSVFLDADLQLLRTIAGHAVQAYANAHRFEEVLERAQRDALTGLANHGHFAATLELEVKRALRYRRELALVMIDVDHFKRFNDQYGHLQGDAALVAVGRTISQRSRSHDTPARYGGDEFAVLLPETAIGGASVFGEKIRSAVEGLQLGSEFGEEGLTLSVGVASLAETDGRPRSLLEAADARLYRAKDDGRNLVRTEAA